MLSSNEQIREKTRREYFDAISHGDLTKIKNQWFSRFTDSHLFNANMVDQNGKTALMYAADNGHLDILRFFLEQRAAVNDQDQDGKSALMYAVDKGNIDIIRLLLKHGAEVSATDEQNRTALKLAVGSHKEDIIKVLIDKVDVFSELKAASKREDTEFVDAILRRMSDRKKYEIIRILTTNIFSEEDISKQIIDKITKHVKEEKARIVRSQRISEAWKVWRLFFPIPIFSYFIRITRGIPKDFDYRMAGLELWVDQKSMLSQPQVQMHQQYKQPPPRRSSTITQPTAKPKLPPYEHPQKSQFL